MIRGALLTPWAAVSLGIALAASLTLATPRAVLTFPPSMPARCQSTGCGPTGSEPSTGPLPTAKLGTKFPAIRTGSSTGLASSTATPAAPGLVHVQYAMLPKYGVHFVAVILIVGQRALGKWTLRFVLPGSQIKLVMLAKWTPVGQDGGIVSSSPWSSGPSGANRARIVILGTGHPTRPRGCVYDGARCSFRDFTGGVSNFDWKPSKHKG